MKRIRLTKWNSWKVCIHIRRWEPSCSR